LPGFDTNTLAANDDGSTGKLNIGFNVDFFGSMHSTLWVNNNGNLTFDAPYSTYTPLGLSGVSTPIIAPFFADVDTRGSGSGLTSYGNGTVDGHAAFGATWRGVGYFGGQTDKLNTFQVLLIDRSDAGVVDFDIQFNYNQIQWETGGNSGGSGGLGGTSAAAGYSNGLAGSGHIYYQLPGSLIPSSFLDGGPDALVSNSNIGVPGTYLFLVRNGEVIPPPSTVPEPENILGATTGLALFGLASTALKKRKLNKS